MIYRESGQFKTTYKADQAILPIFQDKVAMVLLMIFAFVCRAPSPQQDCNNALRENKGMSISPEIKKRALQIFEQVLISNLSVADS